MFRGRAPRSVTTYTYDDAGRLVHAVTEHEPVFLPEDAAELQALAVVEAEECPRCGEDRSKSHAAEGEFAYKAEVVRCHSCATSERAVRAYAKEDGDTAGIITRLTHR